MKVQTELRTSADLLKIVNEAVTEADVLRKRLGKFEKTLLSTRLIMGHELKRPATAIKGYLDLALEDSQEMNDDVVDMIRKAKNECRLLDELNSFYLHLLRIDGNTSTAAFEAVDVASCVDGVLDQIPEGLDAPNRVAVTMSTGASVFRTNPSVLRIVVANLIENALMYSKDGSRVHVNIERAEEKRGMDEADLLKISIEDTGKGIPNDFIQKIFRPFVRLQDDITDGSGLGLTLVRSLVELYGGSVYIRSEENNGTAVHVTIPETAKAEEPSVLS